MIDINKINDKVKMEEIQKKVEFEKRHKASLEALKKLKDELPNIIDISWIEEKVEEKIRKGYIYYRNEDERNYQRIKKNVNTKISKKNYKNFRRGNNCSCSTMFDLTEYLKGIRSFDERHLTEDEINTGFINYAIDYVKSKIGPEFGVYCQFENWYSHERSIYDPEIHPGVAIYVSWKQK